MMLENAERFITLNGRVLERRRFDFLFRGGPAEPVFAALDAYRNDDGGYGHALEPDGRGPGSQPVHVLSALDVLTELDMIGARAAGICDYLASITGPDGGAPFVHPNIREHPRAPWWQVTEDGSGSLLPTASIAGLLHRAGVTHPWLDGADAFCLGRIEQLAGTHAYEAMACARFLDHAPDRPRAQALAKRLGDLVREQDLIAFAGDVREGEAHKPHVYAPTPQSVAAAWFTADELSASLDELAAEQAEDGGWPIHFLVWTPVTEFEWRPIATIGALQTLRAYRS
jgi:hypothetical protein